MLDPELVNRIRQIQITTSHAVNADFAGQYESTFKGRGMEFEEVREYVPGDDVRTIDWNVTARAGRPYIKRYVEERELTVMLAVDLSASGAFGTAGRLKNELAAELCAVLAFAAIRNNDKVGLILFTDRIERFIPPKKGSRHVLRLIRDLLCFEAPRRATRVDEALDFVARVTRKRATVFVVSDFLADGFVEPMSRVNRRHDVIAVSVQDPAELALPRVGLVEWADAETGEVRLVDTSSSAFRRRYAARQGERTARLETTLRSIGVDCISVRTDRPYIQDLVKFFHMRRRRF